MGLSPLDHIRGETPQTHLQTGCALWQLRWWLSHCPPRSGSLSPTSTPEVGVYFPVSASPVVNQGKDISDTAFVPRSSTDTASQAVGTLRWHLGGGGESPSVKQGPGFPPTNCLFSPWIQREPSKGGESMLERRYENGDYPRQQTVSVLVSLQIVSEYHRVQSSARKRGWWLHGTERRWGSEKLCLDYLLLARLLGTKSEINRTERK